MVNAVVEDGAWPRGGVEDEFFGRERRVEDVTGGLEDGRLGRCFEVVFFAIGGVQGGAADERASSCA